MAVIGLLACGHYAEYPSKWENLLRASEECRLCGVTQSVREEWGDCWHSQCRQCSYHRTHGYSRKYADASAQRHASQTGHHSIVLWYNPAPAPARTFIQTYYRSEKPSNKLDENPSPPF